MYRVIPQSNFFADILITCTMRTSDSGNLSNIDWKAIAGNLKIKIMRKCLIHAQDKGKIIRKQPIIIDE